MPNLIYVTPVSESSTVDLLLISCKLNGGGGGTQSHPWWLVEDPGFLLSLHSPGPRCVGDKFFLKYHSSLTFMASILLSSPQDINYQSFPRTYLWLCLLSEDSLCCCWIKYGRRKQLYFKFSSQERRSSQHRDCDSHLSPSETLLLNAPLLPTAPTVDENEGYKVVLPLFSWPHGHHYNSVINICGGYNNDPQSHPCPNPWDLWICYLKRTLQI